MHSVWSNGRRVRPRRAGFTLMELMVAIAIIAILLSLTVAAIFRVASSQKVSATKTVLNKLTPIVKANWNAVAEKAFRDISSGSPTATQYSSYYTAIAGTDANRQKVIYVKLRLGQVFPVSFNEVFNIGNAGVALPGLIVYQKKLQALGITGSSADTAPYESSALLLMALQQGISGQKFNPEDLGNAALGTFPTPNGGTIQALVDGWGSPIAFVRWPTGSSDLNPSGPQLGFFDTTDPQGYLASAAWLTWATSGTPPTPMQKFQIGIGYSPPTTSGTSYALLPLLVSPGADTSDYTNSRDPNNPMYPDPGHYHLGLDQNANTINATDASDNISSAQQ